MAYTAKFEITSQHEALVNAVGTLIRKAYFLTHKQWIIIGFKVNDSGYYTEILNSTDTVFDVGVRLSDFRFDFNPEAIREDDGWGQTIRAYPSRDNLNIIEIQVMSDVGKYSLTTTDIVDTVNKLSDPQTSAMVEYGKPIELIKLAQSNVTPVKLTIYLKEVDCDYPINESKAQLATLGIGTNINPMSALACSNTSLTYKVEPIKNSMSYRLTIEISGERADTVKSVQESIMEFTINATSEDNWEFHES